jgi:hypothetical protein
MFLEQEMIHLHDPIDTLMVHSGLSLFTKTPVDKGSDSPVSVGRTHIGNHPDKGTIYSIVRMGAIPSGSCWLFVEV